MSNYSPVKSNYSQVKFNVEISGAWQQSLGVLGAQGFTTECTYQSNTNDPAYPSSGEYYGQGPNGEQVFLIIGWWQDSFYYAQINYIFETVTGTAFVYPVSEITVGETFSFIGDLPYDVPVGITTVLSNIERLTVLTVPPILEKSRMPLPADALINYAKAVHAGNPAAAGLLANIQAAETAYRLTKAPSTRSAVTIQQSKTAIQILRKNLQDGIADKSKIGVTMPRPQVRQGTPPPKMTIGKWKNGLLDLKVKREKFPGKKWLTLQVMPTPSTLEAGVNIQITKFPMQVDVDDFEGVDYVNEGVVWMRSRWEGVDANGGWFGPWTPWKKYNLPKNPNK